MYALPVDAVSRVWSAARAFCRWLSITAATGCAEPRTRREIRAASSSVVTASRRSSSVPAAWATRLADYLCRHTDVPKDIATHRLARADGLGVHLVQPLLFQHVGTYSVILHHEKNPANVVSAGFSVD